MSNRTDMLNAIKNHLKQNNGNGVRTVTQIREDLIAAAKSLPRLPGVQAVSVTIGRLHGEWVDCTDEAAGSGRGKVILYYHGGGFISGTCEIYRDLAARISAASGARVLTVEYRLAPEHVYPAANEDCLAAYDWLLAEGYSHKDIILGGDSVGASLALMTLITLRDDGKKLPAAAFLLSPHSDLVHLDGESYDSRAELDPTGSRAGNQRILEDYLGDYTGDMPLLLSPLRADLHGLPPLLIQAGDQEVLLSDAERLAERARAAGVQVTLEIWEDLWSVFQMIAAILPEGQQAIGNIGTYVKNIWNLKE
ncbi:alpha/beta hydrolase [Paenibacillus sp. HW567]|uniref:alpha/beta hydrolase n=1 Tax=Paenibacillus sp. HW567 TaxID=1034769 RepID=UPI00037FD97C|nr:alpha/beta hydrolase [Paenibacillus sp. HW567]